MKVSDEKLYSKMYDSYKRYVLYEHNNKDIPLNIFLLNVTGPYHSFNGDNKSVNFILNDGLLEKIYEIFSDIEARLGIAINDFILTNSHDISLNTKVSKDRTCFRQSNEERENIPPRQNTNNISKILIRIESVFFNNKGNTEDVIYYP